jgi:prophage regulatory protein
MSIQRLLGDEDLRARGIDYTDEHRRRLEKLGRFPRRLKLSYRCVKWLETEIDAWIAARAAERDTAA